MDIEQDKDLEYLRLLNDWKHKEREYEEALIEDEQKRKKKEEELPKCIEDDLKYDSAADIYNKSSPYYSKHSKGN
jgi:hypothetical protein